MQQAFWRGIAIRRHPPDRSLQIGPDRAMELLMIPQKERKGYRAILTNNKEKKKVPTEK